MLYYEGRNKAPHKFYIHCNTVNCNHWIQIKFNDRGGVTLRKMPRNVKFRHDRIPTVVLGD